MMLYDIRGCSVQRNGSFTFCLYFLLYSYHITKTIMLFAVIPFLLRKNTALLSVQNKYLNFFLTFLKMWIIDFYFPSVYIMRSSYPENRIYLQNIG